ncbi:MAG: D-2-hydroxyacid dehydrogenase [Candidatus Cyclobacteriaceae bacterium M3_2C_046]
MKIYVHLWLEPDNLSYLKSVLSEHKVWYRNDIDSDQREAACKQADVVFGNVPASWLKDQNNVRWFQLDSVGFDAYLTIDWKAKNMQLTNLRGMYGVPVAETALAGILAFYRKIDQLVAFKEKKYWGYQKIRAEVRCLHRASVLILGGGSIGLTLKKLLSSFDCHITIYGRDPKKSDIFDIENLEKKLAESDIVIGCLPNTALTTNLLNAQRLRLLTPSSLLVNVGRGSLIDEEALAELLHDKKIGGAVLEVTQLEPLPDNHPLWDCPNLILTQHAGGGSANENRQKMDIFLDNLKRFKQGNPLKNTINLSKGY